MISSKHLRIVLDNIKNADPVGEFARNLHNTGTTETQLLAALNGRNDAVATALLNSFRLIASGQNPVNQYGVASPIRSTRPSKAGL